MPLGSESASLTQRGLAAVRAAGRGIVHNISSPGAPIAAPKVPVGGYTPGVAALDAAINFAAGSRAAANYRVKLAAARVQQRHMDLLNQREEQLLHPETQDVQAPWGVEKGLTTAEASALRRETWFHDHPSAASPARTITDPRTGKEIDTFQFAANERKLADDRAVAREQRVTGQQKGIAALRLQNTVLGEQQRQSDTLAADVASKQTTAWQQNAMAEIDSGKVGPFLSQLGITDADLKQRPQLLNLVEDHASRMRTDLERQFKTTFGSGVAAKRAQLNQRLAQSGGVDFGDDTADQPSPMDDLLRQFGAQ